MRGIPIRIQPFFWLVAALIGWFGSRTLVGTLIWVAIILVSVLVHELGHALAAKAFGLSPRIDLVAIGGVTTYEIKNLKYYKQFLITLSGPVFGFLLFVLASVLLYFKVFTNPLAITVTATIQMINLFWTIVNLVPVLPLDGGQLLRIALEGFFGVKGFKLSLFIGMTISLLISLFFFLIGYFLVGAIFFLFAFQSFDAWKKSKNISSEDREINLSEEFQKGETAYLSGDLKSARDIFKDLREKSHKGMIFSSATHYLALMEYEQGNKHESYELLLSVKEHLSEEALCLLQRLAFDEKNYHLVVELSSTCFQLTQNQEVALINARAFASINEPKPAGGWLQTALKYGNLDVEKILNENFFDKVKNDPKFLSFFKK